MLPYRSEFSGSVQVAVWVVASAARKPTAIGGFTPMHHRRGRQQRGVEPGGKRDIAAKAGGAARCTAHGGRGAIWGTMPHARLLLQP
jgi:hypothetical protein